MYSGSQLVQLLKEKSTYLSENSRQGNVIQSRSPLFGAYLAVLNDLAQHDLNFQNLCVLYNLVSLCPEFEDDKRQSNRPAWEMKGNCLIELVDKLGQQLGPAVAEDKSISRSSITHEGRQSSQQTTGIVIGYPAVGQLSEMPSDVDWLSGSYDYRQSMPYEAAWQTRWPWQNWPTGTYDEPTMNVSQERSIEDGNYAYGYGDDRRPFEVEASLYKCNSWPLSMTVPVSEGCTTGNVHTPTVDEDPFGGDAPFDLNEELPMDKSPDRCSIGLSNVDRMSDLERFLEMATPRIPVSRASIDAMTTDDVWQFYELSSVYGLQVPFFKGNESLSVAHFSPSLSAVRLFTTVARIAKDDSRIRDIYICDELRHPRLMQLEFEFCETMKPHVRRPLYDEIINLQLMGASGKKLPSLRLSELHPSSWFSVAWYPIYCIPEGKLRASFLTFHSFGSVGESVDGIGGMEIHQAPLIGIRFMLLSLEHWKRPKASSTIEAEATNNASAHTVQYSRSKNDADIPRTSEGQQGFRDEEDWSLPERSRNLEKEIHVLQCTAERLARASHRCVMHGSERPSTPHQFYHSDFEFFVQRS